MSDDELGSEMRIANTRGRRKLWIDRESSGTCQLNQYFSSMPISSLSFPLYFTLLNQ